MPGHRSRLHPRTLNQDLTPASPSCLDRAPRGDTQHHDSQDTGPTYPNENGDHLNG